MQYSTTTFSRKAMNYRGLPQYTNGILPHYSDVIMGVTISQISSLTIVYSTFYSDADRRKHQSSAPLAFVPGIHRGLVNSPHKWPVTWQMFPFDDVIMSRRIPIMMVLWPPYLCNQGPNNWKMSLIWNGARDPQCQTIYLIYTPKTSAND